jgi:fumarate reductase subunit D
MARATGETIWWSLFAVGGVLIALLIPVLIFVTGIAIPFVHIGAVPNVVFDGFEIIDLVLTSWIGRLVLSLALTFPFIHCAHRIVHTSKDLGLRAAHGLIALVFYGAAIVASLFALYVIWL